MPRRKKSRTVCSVPTVTLFSPEGGSSEYVTLSVDEYEAVRLIDRQGFSQERCASCMNIARTTAQQIYNEARKKLAFALTEGLEIRIDGGDYSICEGGNPHCGCEVCRKANTLTQKVTKKGENIMKIAVTHENGMVFQHFGHTEEFKIYEIENNNILLSSVVSTNGTGHGALAGILSQLGVDTLICGGIGGGAKIALSNAGIKFFGGVSGSCDEAVKALLEGKLNYNPNEECNHHHDHHHDEGHSCGSHGCGNHGCH